MGKGKKNLGYGFPDEVAKVTFKSSKFSAKGGWVFGPKKGVLDEWKDTLLPNFKSFETDNPDKNFWLQTIFLVGTLGLFFVIFLRLFNLQVISGKQNRELADGNRIQIKIIHAPRGVIFDRNGKVLAANAPAFRLIDQLHKNSRLISREEALEMEVANDPQSVDLEVDNVRVYPMGEKTAHLVGYVGQISQNQLSIGEYKNYKAGDLIGQNGIEAQYEKILKGVDGGEIIEVDSRGKKIRSLRVNQPKSGRNIYLNIDSDLQQKLYDAIKDTLSKTGSCCGVAVAENPTSGEILALVSLPSFDPNIFTKNIDENAISEILSRPDAPVLNRAIGGTYPPGSTFKIVTAVAGLESLKITPQTTFLDNGVMYLGDYRFSNWYFNQYGKTEGSVNLVKAIERSNDIYFYQAGRLIGVDLLGEWAGKLGFGKLSGIDLPGEVKGLVPDDNWKQKTFGQIWYPGDTLHMAIGQGFMLTTPLQILQATSFIADNGRLYKPSLVNKVMSSDAIVAQFKPQILISDLVNPSFLKTIKEGMMLVPKFGGTAWPFFTFPIETAGKTGTAEFGDRKDRTHAWYTSFAPVNNPKIALTVLIEGGGEGSSVAAPIAKEVYRWYFSPDKNHLIPDIYPISTSSAKQFGE